MMCCDGKIRCLRCKHELPERMDENNKLKKYKQCPFCKCQLENRYFVYHSSSGLNALKDYGGV